MGDKQKENNGFINNELLGGFKGRFAEKVADVMKKLLPEPVEEALTVEAFKTLNERYVLSDFLTYGHADDDYEAIWLDDNPKGPNSVLLGYHVSPLIMAGERATAKIEKMISRLPVGSILYSIAHASDDIEGFLENWAMSRRENGEPIFDLITKRRIQHLLNWASGKTRPMPKGSSFKPRGLNHYMFVRIPADFKNYTQENLSAYIEQVDTIHNTVVSQMQTANMPLLRMKGSEMAVVIKSLANPNLTAKDSREQGINVAQSLPSQIIPASNKHIIDKDGMITLKEDGGNQKEMAVMTVSKYHDRSPHYLSDMQHCIGSMIESEDFIPGNFYAFTILEKQDTSTKLKGFAKKLATAEWHTSVQSQIFQNLFRRHHEVKQNVYDFLDKVNNGAGVVKAICGIVIATDSKPSLELACSAASSAWGSAGVDLVRETSIALPVWLASLPGRYTPDMDGVNEGLQRGITMTALNAATLMHVQGDWKGSHPADGGMLLLTRRGVLATLNLFKTFKANYNCLVAASSGAGKSFLMADWVADFLTRKGRVRIIDAGRSYYNLAEVVSGQNVVCDDKTKLCFNIFTTLTTKDLLDESLTMVTRLIAQMCYPGGYADDSSGGDKPWEESFIGFAIEKIWSSKRHNMSILDIYNYCEKRQNDDPRIKDLVMLLYKWSKGHHKKWFVGEWNIDFDNPFMVFELDELKKDKDLQNVILNLLLARITNEMYYSWIEEQKRDDGEIMPKAIIIDEAWDLLSRPSTARFIEEAARRIRKYYGSIIIITQSFMDMNKNTAALAFIQNSNWVISLMQDIGMVKKAVKDGLIDLQDHALNILESLQKTDDYSELYVLNKSVKGEGVYRANVDPASYWAYTTDGAEKAKLNKLVSKGLSISEAIDQLTKPTIKQSRQEEEKS